MSQAKHADYYSFGAKERLLDAGLRLVASCSHEPITTRRLAEEAGVNHALIAYHYGGMPQLMQAVREQSLKDLDALVVPEIAYFAKCLAAAGKGKRKALFEDACTRLVTVLQKIRHPALLHALSTPNAECTFAQTSCAKATCATPNCACRTAAPAQCAPACVDMYPYFMETIAQPLFTCFVNYLNGVQGSPNQADTANAPHALDIPVQAQLLLAQVLAFLQHGALVKNHLAIADFDDDQQDRVTRTVVANLLRSVGI